MMETKKVSLVVTCYNLEKVIARCLHSLCTQTYGNLQIIVVDDGSKDNSFEIIREAAEKDPRITPVFQENAGPSAARNHGIDLSDGEYLMFIDGDDYVADTYVENFVEAADGCDMVIGALCYVYPDNTQSATPETVFCCDKAEYVRTYYTQSVTKRTIFGPVNKLYRSAIVKDNDIRFREELAIREDGLFVLDVLEHVEQLSGIDKAEYYYIQNAPGTSLVSKFHADELRINQLFVERLVAVIGAENMTDDHVRQFHAMLLNMDIASVRKLYNSGEYTLRNGLCYIRSVLQNEAFRKARWELKQVDPKLARKFYRPLLMIHIINYMAVKLGRAVGWLKRRNTKR